MKFGMWGLAAMLAIRLGPIAPPGAGSVYVNSAPGPGTVIFHAFPRTSQDYIAISRSNVLRLRLNGEVDSGYTPPLPPGCEVRTAALEPGGGLLLGGSFAVDGRATHVARVDRDGRLDPTFPKAVFFSVPPGDVGEVTALGAIASDGAGGCYVAGWFTSVNGAARSKLVRVRAGGVVENVPAYSAVAIEYPQFLAGPPDGLFIVEETAVYRLTGPGNVTALGTLGQNWREIERVAWDPRFGLALCSRVDNGAALFVIDPQGRLNPAFQPQVQLLSIPPQRLCWDDAGRLLATNLRLHPLDNLGIKRFLPDGSLDPSWSRAMTFDLPPVVALPLPNGRIMVSGGFREVNGRAFPGYVELSGVDTPSALRNQSVRGFVERGQRRVILGFVLTGETSRDCLIRAVGPTLAKFGVTEIPARTRFSLYRGSDLVTDVPPTVQLPNRGSELILTILEPTAALGAFGLEFNGLYEAQKYLALFPGAYTAVIDIEESASGEVLGEVYVR